MRTFDDFSLPGFWQNPFPYYQRSFSQAARIQSSPDGGVAVLGYELSRKIGMHPAIDGTPLPASVEGDHQFGNEILRHGLFTQVLPEHRHLRRAVLTGLSNNTVKAFAPAARKCVTRKLEEWGDQNFDLFLDFCLPIAAECWALFAGYGADQAPHLIDEVERFSKQLSFEPDPALAEDAENAAASLLARTVKVVERADDCPVHRMADELGDKRGAPLAASLLFDAIDTAAAGLAGMLAVLLDEVREKESLGDPVFREQAIEEALRLATPTPFTVRQARESVRVDDLTIPAGALVWMWWSAANRDPEVFADPEQFLPGRERRGLPFGIGVHSCVGHGWAKQLAHILVEAGLSGPRRLEATVSDRMWKIGGARRPYRLMVRMV